jgi:hypothetical protein
MTSQLKKTINHLVIAPLWQIWMVVKFKPQPQSIPDRWATLTIYAAYLYGTSFLQLLVTTGGYREIELTLAIAELALVMETYLLLLVVMLTLPFSRSLPSVLLAAFSAKALIFAFLALIGVPNEILFSTWSRTLSGVYVCNCLFSYIKVQSGKA